mmetsp:Transcript_39249/g.82073  ORF Transcript_39249/g.82073 Transcript_39249/m.82073 type:complete len:200 (-) Transcript_39249:671-1270(-)
MPPPTLDLCGRPFVPPVSCLHRSRSGRLVTTSRLLTSALALVPLVKSVCLGFRRSSIPSFPVIAPDRIPDSCAFLSDGSNCLDDVTARRDSLFRLRTLVSLSWTLALGLVLDSMAYCFLVWCSPRTPALGLVLDSSAQFPLLCRDPLFRSTGSSPRTVLVGLSSFSRTWSCRLSVLAEHGSVPRLFGLVNSSSWLFSIS